MVSTTQYDQADRNVFDYIIVGGGTAGLVLAARLTEDSTVQVVVLEAGEKRLEDPRINIPGLMSTLYSDENYDWNFKTAAQPGLNDRVIHWPRGKALGGSSAINYLMASHASRVDLNNWERLGNPGWNFDTLQPYYRKSETYNPPSEEAAKSLHTSIIDPNLHGNSGPLQTSFPAGTGALDSAWPHAFATLGLESVGDPRDGSTLGGYNLTKYMDSAAKRSYSAPAYYAPNAERGNLTVLTNAFVHNIEFEVKNAGVTATGIKYSVDGKEHFVKTRGEVIISAGTVQSPQILELSGIGSKARLEKLGVKVVVANPNVGENLQDHPMVSIAYEALDGIPTAEMIKQPGVLDWALQQWTQKGAGPLAAGVTGTSFLSHSSVLPTAQREYLRARTLNLLEEATIPTHPGLQKQYQLQKEMLLDDQEADLQFNFGASGLNPKSGEDVSKFFTHDDEGGYAGIPTALTHAFSRGSIHIQSSDPAIHPAINPRYLSHPIDLEIISDGLLFTQTIAEAAPLADLLKDNDASDGKRIQPSFNVKGRMTKERAVELVKESVATSFHPVGTCSMLPEEDGGVVDGRLRVYGVTNLRVVDASVAPLHVRGNIASLVYAVAERAADLIKEDRKA